jgi:hypothetical protein
MHLVLRVTYHADRGEEKCDLWFLSHQLLAIYFVTLFLGDRKTYYRLAWMVSEASCGPGCRHDEDLHFHVL